MLLLFWKKPESPPIAVYIIQTQDSRAVYRRLTPGETTS